MRSLKWQLLLYQILLQHLEAERNFRILTTLAECRSYMPEYIDNATCSLSTYNGTNYLNGILRLRKLTPKVKMHWLLEFTVPKRSKLTLINLKIDGCGLLSKSRASLFLENGAKNLKKYINAPLECPPKLNFTYIIKNYSFDENVLPSYVPEGQFHFSSTAYRKEKVVFKFVTAGEIIHNVKMNVSHKVGRNRKHFE